MKFSKDKELDYKFKLSTVRSEMSGARWWQGLDIKERSDFAKMVAQDDYAAELQIAEEFGKSPEPIAIKIKRIFAKYDSLAKKYPIEKMTIDSY